MKPRALCVSPTSPSPILQQIASAHCSTPPLFLPTHRMHNFHLLRCFDSDSSTTVNTLPSLPCHVSRCFYYLWFRCWINTLVIKHLFYILIYKLRWPGVLILQDYFIRGNFYCYYEIQSFVFYYFTVLYH